MGKHYTWNPQVGPLPLNRKANSPNKNEHESQGVALCKYALVHIYQQHLLKILRLPARAIIARCHCNETYQDIYR